jgi:hypothetical protein
MNAKDTNLFRFIIPSGVRNLLFGFLTLVIPMQQRSRSLTARLRASLVLGIRDGRSRWGCSFALRPFLLFPRKLLVTYRVR